MKLQINALIKKKKKKIMYHFWLKQIRKQKLTKPKFQTNYDMMSLQ